MGGKAGKPDLKPESLSAQGLHWLDPATGEITPPVHISATYARDEANQLHQAGFSYARDHNPLYRQLEALLTRLEGGEEALVFSSGMAAATALLQGLRPGERALFPKIMYWALRNWMVEFSGSWGLGLDFYEPGDTASLEAAAAQSSPALIWVETPANPTWEVTDLAAAAQVARTHGAILAVDSTVPTPVLTRPIEHGADFVFHSATKYLNGHSDIVAGALVARRADHPFWVRAKAQRAYGGGILGPFEAWLLLRGMRTLYLRVRTASQTALALARHFEGHPAVASVLYPGLESHPGHAVARKQMQGGFGGMLSLRIAGGRQAALDVACALQVFTRATSLGGV
ncbi:MAG: PLP-dependent aspartate aminotransferase family protein, partial [Rhodovibrionaceae bacterium]|nr:PLP-dependent aspartate aminotransferase family protein [Rhodovibrionaceae bacterium]